MADTTHPPQRSNNKTWIGILVAVLAVAAAVAIYFAVADDDPAGGEDLVVDVDGNLPLSGPVAAWSGQYPSGFQMGVEDARQEYDVPAENLDLNFQDNAAEPSQAVSVMQQQRLGDIDVYVSGTSEMSNAIASEVERLDVPHFIAAFDAYIARESPNRLRIMPHYKIEGPEYLDYIRARGAERVYIVGLNISSVEEEFAEIVEPGLEAASVAFEREMYDFNTEEFRTLALRVAQYQPDLIIINGFSFHLYPLIRALRNQDLIQDGNVLATMDFVDLLYGDTPLSELAGIAFVTPLSEIPSAVEGIEEWRQRFEQRFGERPTYVAAYGYDTGRIVVAAYDETGEVTPESIRAVLPFNGIVGTIELDEDGDLMTTLAVARVTEDGQIVRVDQ